MKTNQLIILLGGVILLVGLFLVTKPKQPNNIPQEPQTSAALPQPKTFELSIKNKKLSSGSETINVTEGEKVVLKITSDIQEELHLHGYDISVDLEKDTPAELSFTASISGRFVFELEKSKTDLGAVEVAPK